jgi:hypothetical protein
MFVARGLRRLRERGFGGVGLEIARHFAREGSRGVHPPLNQSFAKLPGSEMMSSRMRWAIMGILVTAMSGVCVLAGIAAADTPRIFRSGNGAFQFRYAPELVRCETQDAKVTPGQRMGAGRSLPVQ